jgi:hypothetical protein
VIFPRPPQIVLVDPPGSGLFNAVTRGVAFAAAEAEGRRLRHPCDTITEGIGINRLTANFRLAQARARGLPRGACPEPVSSAGSGCVSLSGGQGTGCAPRPSCYWQGLQHLTGPLLLCLSSGRAPDVWATPHASHTGYLACSPIDALFRVHRPENLRLQSMLQTHCQALGPDSGVGIRGRPGHASGGPSARAARRSTRRFRAATGRRWRWRRTCCAATASSWAPAPP